MKTREQELLDKIKAMGDSQSSLQKQITELEKQIEILSKENTDLTQERDNALYQLEQK